MRQQGKGRWVHPVRESGLMCLFMELRLDFQDKISFVSKASSRSLMCCIGLAPVCLGLHLPF